MNIGRLKYFRYDPKRKNRKSRTLFAVEDVQRFRHTWVIGKTGVGKSTALENWILQDIRAGNGIAVIDPHGALADAVLELIPPRRWKDVILFDPSDRDYPIGFNIFDRVPEVHRPRVASHIITNFKNIWSYENTPTPEMDKFLYTTAAALMDCPGQTLLGMKYILTSEDYRKRVLSFVRDPVLKDVWLTDFERLSARDKYDRTNSTLNKLITILSDPTLRNVVAQSTNKLSFREIMDERKIFIARLPQGELGETKSSLIGALLISALHLAALGRPPNPLPFYAYVDEFHNFSIPTEALSGLRKFGVSLTLCHQYIAQLPEDLVEAMLGTVGTMIAFQIGPNDAQKLATTFHVKAEDMSSLDPFTAYVNAGKRTIELVMEPPPGQLYPASPEKIRRRCRATYAIRRKFVEKRLQDFVEEVSSGA